LKRFDLFEQIINGQKGKVFYVYQAKIKTHLHVSFTAKTVLHHFYKKMGLLSNLEIGVAEFDQRIYMTSDEKAVVALLLDADHKIASLILHFFIHYKDVEFSIKDKMIEITVVSKKMKEESLAILAELRKMINQSSPKFAFKPDDRKTYQKMLIVEIILGLLLSQAIAGFILFFEIFYAHFDLSEILIRAIPLYFGLSVFSIALVKLVLKSSSLIAEILTEITFLVFILYPFLAISTISDINIYFDESSAKSTEMKLIDKSRGAAEFFYLPNPKDPNDTEKFEVLKKTWYEADVGDTILVWQKAGYLNIPYITDFEVKKVKDEAQEQKSLKEKK
jgi:hypothetical protein